MAPIPHLYVSPPTKQALPFRLLDAVDWRNEKDSHWKAGVEWQSNCGVSATTLDPCITGGVIPAKDDTGGRESRAASPFTVYASVECSAPGSGWEKNMQDARELLEISESYAVERAFWTGSAAGISNAVYPRLAANSAVFSEGTQHRVTLQTAATVVTGGAGVTSHVGLGALEAAIAACNNGVSYIHVPLIAIPALMYRTLIFERNGQLRTLTGNVVVPGAGYANTGPDGTPAGVGQAWIYGTGAMLGYRSGVRMFTREESLDRTVNTLNAIAERTYVLGFECCHYAVLINL